MDTWENRLDEIKQFSQNRNDIIHNQFSSVLDLDGTVQVTLVIEPPGTGRVSINDVSVIRPDGVGIYFKNKPISLLAQPNPGYQFLGWDGVSDSIQIDYNCFDDTTFTAVFQFSDEVILPGMISENTLLTNEHPYAVIQDLTIASGATLSISEGVEIRMSDGGNILIEGQLIINGAEENPVLIVPNTSSGSTRWGAICFNNDADTSTISHLMINGASTGADPMIHQGAISSINSHIILDHIEIENVVFPIYVEGGSITINNSSLASDFTCDYINVRAGDTIIENCVFYGRDAPDTDAIDLDNVSGSIIRNNRIYDFSGSNSDGIDIGESSDEVIIFSNLIYHAGDKGISIGQGSTATVERNLIVGCNNGIAVKDNSAAIIVNNTFFFNDTTVSCYEKNEGQGGGTADIANTIFSSNLSSSIYSDDISVVDVRYSLSDSELINGEGNLFSDPVFIDQSIYNLELDPSSPCMDAGDPDSQSDPDGSPIDIGAYYIYNPDDYPFEIPDQLIGQLKINEFLASNDAFNVDEAGEFDDWLELFNPADQAIDLSGLYLTDDLENLTRWQFPATNITIAPGGHVLIWCDDNGSQGDLHTNFNISSTGEILALVRSDGTTIIDSISFGLQTTNISYGRIPDGSEEWTMMSPTPGHSNQVLSILSNMVSPDRYRLYQNYPNPFNSGTSIRYDLPENGHVRIIVYDILGIEITTLVNSDLVIGNHMVHWNAARQPSGIYFVRIESGSFEKTRKMVLLK